MKMTQSFAGKTALVLASSQGLGKAIAEKFASEGANVVIASRDGSKLEEVKKELSEHGQGKVDYAVCDITKPEDLQALVQKTVNAFGTIDILVNNAGGPPAGKFEDMSDEQWQKAF